MQKSLSFLLLFFGVFYLNTVSPINAQCATPSVTQASGTHAPQGTICPGQLIFEDNFDRLDLKKWQHEQTLGGGGNWEFQWYTNSRSNSYTENGVLHLKPTLLADEAGEDFLYHGTLDINGGSPADECTNPQWWGCARTGSPESALNPVKSARLRTLYSFSYKYGKLEIRAKLPTGDWLWPAIWMLPRDNQYSTWPQSGEIDIMESRGNRAYINENGQNIGVQQVAHTLHWGPAWNINKWPLTHWEANNPAGYDDDFHLYQFEWTPSGLVFRVDNVETGRINTPSSGFWNLGDLDSTGYENPWRFDTNLAPFDQEFYLLLNLACGGVAYFPDTGRNAGGKPWRNDAAHASTDFWNGKGQWYPTWQPGTDASHFQIDYVRVWAV